MLSALQLQASTPVIELGFTLSPTGNTKMLRYPYNLRLLARSTRSLCTRSQYDAAEPSVPSQFTASVGNPSSPPSLVLPRWNFTHRHIVVLNVIACAVAVSATWLFCSAIPTLLAFKKAAESLEKLMDVMREELPDTMTAVRLSGMEISDLTMELSDLGQEITTGVRSSTRAVRVAEEKLRHMTNMSPSASMQEVANPKNEPSGPLLARTARGIRTSIVKGRGVLQTFFTCIRFYRMVQNYFNKRQAKRPVG